METYVESLPKEVIEVTEAKNKNLKYCRWCRRYGQDFSKGYDKKEMFCDECWVKYGLSRCECGAFREKTHRDVFCRGCGKPTGYIPKVNRRRYQIELCFVCSKYVRKGFRCACGYRNNGRRRD